MKNSTRLAVLIWLVSVGGLAQAQLASSCQTCFTSEIVKATKTTSQCADYQIKVSYNGKCDHALSHFTVAVPACASVSNLSTDQISSLVSGYDPTTGLNGFKVEDISNFGQSSLKSFVVSFTLCSSSSNCDTVSCWSPIVAYKASTCFELDTLKGLCSNLQAHLEQKDITCFGASNGSLNAIVDSGVAPYQYTWSTNSTNFGIQNLPSGNYSVDIKDATGAKVSLSATLSQPSQISITSSIVNASCNGKSNGSIELSVSGGTGKSYSYLWNTGATSSSLDSVKAGSYFVTVKDSLGCSANAVAQIKNEKQITLSFSPLLPSCNQSNGSLSVTASEGAGPYTYQWSSGDTTATIQNLHAGNYTVTVVDAEGCTATSNCSLHENNTLKISYNVTPTSCVDDASGAISVSVTGGTLPYGYAWSNGVTSKDLQGLTAGTYLITVTDSAGCQVSARISVFKKTFQITSQIKQPLCWGDSTGSISLTPSGGTAPYQFSWSTGASADSIKKLASGIYKVTVTDSTGCSKLMSFTIVSPTQLHATDSILNRSCTQFSIDLAVTGGTKPYQYQWSNGAQTEDLASISSGNYQVNITDANKCSLSKEIKIDSMTNISCSIKPVSQPPICSSSGNLIFTEVTNAIYQWQLTSSDGSWSIQSGAANDTLIYMAGNANTTATFSLTISKNGCSQTCTYLLSSCASSGGGNNESCGDCFNSTISQNAQGDSCFNYTVIISTDGNCRYDLSHFVVAVPCGEVADYSDSKNWPLVVGTDPTTGLIGLKVDNANGFGKTPDSFVLQFSVCGSSECVNQLKNWNPVVAYKAGQCIAYDTLHFLNSSNVAVYPNPVRESFSVEVTSDQTDVATVYLFNQYGQQVNESISTPVTEAQKSVIKIEAASLPPGVYFYKVKTSTSNYRGKILKVN